MPEFVVTVQVEYFVEDAADRSEADGQALNYFLGMMRVGNVDVVDIREAPQPVDPEERP